MTTFSPELLAALQTNNPEEIIKQAEKIPSEFTQFETLYKQLNSPASSTQLLLVVLFLNQVKNSGKEISSDIRRSIFHLFNNQLSSLVTERGETIGDFLAKYGKLDSDDYEAFLGQLQTTIQYSTDNLTEAAKAQNTGYVIYWLSQVFKAEQPMSKRLAEDKKITEFNPKLLYNLYNEIDKTDQTAFLDFLKGFFSSEITDQLASFTPQKSPIKFFIPPQSNTGSTPNPEQFLQLLGEATAAQNTQKVASYLTERFPTGEELAKLYASTQLNSWVKLPPDKRIAEFDVNILLALFEDPKIIRQVTFDYITAMFKPEIVCQVAEYILNNASKTELKNPFPKETLYKQCKEYLERHHFFYTLKDSFLAVPTP